MRSRKGMFCRVALVLIALIVMMGTLAISALAQSSSSAGKKTAPPASWPEKWIGMYEGQDRLGKVAPLFDPAEIAAIKQGEQAISGVGAAASRTTASLIGMTLRFSGIFARPTWMTSLMLGWYLSRSLALTGGGVSFRCLYIIPTAASA